MGVQAGRGVVAAGLAVLVAGCSQGAPSGASRTSVSSAASSSSATSPAETSTTTGSAETPTVLAPASFPESQQEYTSVLVRAWGAGDRGRARWYATEAAMNKLFGAKGRGGPGWSLLGCDNAGPLPACTFSDRQTKQRLVLFYDADKLAAPRAVLDLEFISDFPSTPSSS